MKVAFETSVLVAGLVESHPGFARAAPWLDALGTGELTGFWTCHAYAETWSVLTRLPLSERLAPRVALQVVDSLVQVCAPTPLSADDYRAAAGRAAAAGARSGAIFDALHLVAAERAGVDALLTLNERDFLRLSPGVRVLAPPARVELG